MAIKKETGPKKKKKKCLVKLSKLKTKADAVFSIYIRRRDDHICFTCGKRMDEKESQCGHYESRRHLATRYDEENCHCQCVGCNVFRYGNMAIYAFNLEKKYGTGILQKLRKKTQKTIKVSECRELLNKIIKKYG